MRILTGFLPPTEGRASVAGFDVVEAPIEVKKRIGYLPESPPIYPEMEVGDYLDFVGRIKGIPGNEIGGRIESVLERCSIGDVRRKLIGHLSKGYRQRVGLAQALIHNPAVLILDEPTAGLDPKQIIEVRQLIHALSGEHTIILSTHILPEVQTISTRIIIINEGRLEASDSPENLMARLRGHETLLLEVDGPAEEIQGRLTAVEGVNNVSRKNGHGGRTSWEVETGKDPDIRARLSRAVVEAGWGLYEIRSIGLSLEEIFLKLTGGEEAGGTSSEPGSADLSAAPTAEIEPADDLGEGQSA
jgi:ABC-2 type transport system ATP-binding protein